MNPPANAKTDTNAHSERKTTPWYKEPWAWFIVGIVATSITWGLFQLSVAFRKADSVVVDDYYKNGKAINIDLTRDENAKALDIAALLTLDALTGEIQVEVTGKAAANNGENKTDDLPDTLKLSLLSPAFADQDQRIILKRSISGLYVGQLEQEISGQRYIQLETLDTLIPEVGYESGWRISQRTDIQGSMNIQLTPQ